MAANALAIVSLEVMKTELRLTTDDFDDMLTGQIAEAVSWVERQTGIVLVDRTVVIYPAEIDLHAISKMAAWRISDTFVRAVSRIAYWTPDAEPSAAADGELTTGYRWAPDQTASTVRRRGGLLYPPAGGWPDMHPDLVPEIQVTQGLTATAIPPDAKRAVKLIVRQLFQGSDEIRPTSGIFRFVNPLKRLRR